MNLFLFGLALWFLSPGPASAHEPPDLTGSWALLQVIAEHWEAPLLGERLRRVTQIARIRIDHKGQELLLWSEEVCSMVFDLGTALFHIAVAPEFLRDVRVGPLPARVERAPEGFVLVVPPHLILNGVRLAHPDDPLPTEASDPRVLDPDGDGKPGFTVRIRVLGLLSGEAYVVQRLRQEYRGRIVSADQVRGTILWQDEQVTLGASSPFFLISGRGRPAPERAFFVMRRIRGTESCAELVQLFAEDLGP
ncbi:MAG: hypothetical protein N2507_06165 [Candidatus Bipolaricaulota bacterium]|nr:hypothetical protein [Candidatus Bipolaricaulota bacterium]